MFSIPQIAFGLLMLVGAAIWWIVRGLDRRNLSAQISQTIDALNGSTERWRSKLEDPKLQAYARMQILCNDVDRMELETIQMYLNIGERLSVRQIVRLEKLVSEHLVERSSTAPAHIAAQGR